MKNYVVIDGERYDFVNVSKKADDVCSICALKECCAYEDTPCSVFNSSSKVITGGSEYAFVKHEIKSSKK